MAGGWTRLACVVTCVWACAVRGPVTAQTPPVAREAAGSSSAQDARAGAGGSLFVDVWHDYRRYVASSGTYLTLGLGLGASLGLAPLDQRVTISRFNGERYQDRRADGVLEGGELLGDGFLQVGAAFTTYAIGALAGQGELSGLGRDLVRAQLLNGGVTHALKHTVRRVRPDGSHPVSFPSGHASATFATATVFQRRYGWKAGGPALAVATYVAASRLSENKHYLSDVIFGAAVGLSAGRSVTFARGSTRFELVPIPALGGGGVLLAVDLP